MKSVILIQPGARKHNLSGNILGLFMIDFWEYQFIYTVHDQQGDATTIILINGKDAIQRAKDFRDSIKTKYGYIQMKIEDCIYVSDSESDAYRDISKWMYLFKDSHCDWL